MTLEPEIVFCDNHILLAVKPALWLTQPDQTDNPSVEDFAKAWVKKEFNKPGNVFLHAIHRLDRPVSGLVLFARTSKALSRLNELVRAQKIKRIYIAEVEGSLEKESDTLKHFLIHGERKAILSNPSNKEAKEALLSYKVLKTRDHSSLVEIELQTGRYHQIRAQFSAIGHPVLGDQKYGSERNSKGIHLHSYALKFSHPVTKESLSFESSAYFD